MYFSLRSHNSVTLSRDSVEVYLIEVLESSVPSKSRLVIYEPRAISSGDRLKLLHSNEEVAFLFFSLSLSLLFCTLPVIRDLGSTAILETASVCLPAGVTRLLRPSQVTNEIGGITEPLERFALPQRRYIAYACTIFETMPFNADPRKTIGALHLFSTESRISDARARGVTPGTRPPPKTLNDRTERNVG